MSAPTQPPVPTAGELWYEMEVQEREYEWKECGLDYVRTLIEKYLADGREASRQVEIMEHEIRGM